MDELYELYLETYERAMRDVAPINKERSQKEKLAIAIAVDDAKRKTDLRSKANFEERIRELSDGEASSGYDIIQ